MSNSFNSGDVVRLKSGGPKMTVESARGASNDMAPLVWCSWFDGSEKKSDTFHPDALERA